MGMGADYTRSLAQVSDHAMKSIAAKRISISTHEQVVARACVLPYDQVTPDGSDGTAIEIDYPLLGALARDKNASVFLVHVVESDVD